VLRRPVGLPAYRIALSAGNQATIVTSGEQQ